MDPAPTPRWRRFLQLLAAVLVVGTAAVWFSPVNGSAATSVECQHPLITGEEAIDLRHVSSDVACRIVRAIPAYERANHVTPLYRCVGGDSQTGRPYHPVTALHHFHGWNVGVVKGRLSFWRGTSFFSVTGTDFGAYCD